MITLGDKVKDPITRFKGVETLPVIRQGITKSQIIDIASFVKEYFGPKLNPQKSKKMTELKAQPIDSDVRDMMIIRYKVKFPDSLLSTEPNSIIRL